MNKHHDSSYDGLVSDNEKGLIYLAEPRGFCAGVRRALEAVENALRIYRSPVYVLHEIVHNDHVVKKLLASGVLFVEDLSEVPDGAVLVFSAHGVAKSVEQEAERRKLRCIDATCPLVKKIHCKASAYEKDNYKLILIGHKKHPELIGTLGQLSHPAVVIEKAEDIDRLKMPPSSSKLAYLTQTTFGGSEADDILRRLKTLYPLIQGAGDICYATRNRQNAVRLLTQYCDCVIIIGSLKSSNSNRMKEAAEKNGVKAFLINSADEFDSAMLENVSNIGISAGASAPEYLVVELLEALKKKGWTKISTLSSASENTRFSAPELKF